MPVETVTVQMSRSNAQTNWGFRLQGGKEHGQSLAIGRVTEGGLADRAGLKEDDQVVEISNRKAESFTHNEAQQSILNSGNNLKLVVNRNVSTIWSPSFPVDEKNVQGTTTVTLEGRGAANAPGTGSGGYSTFSRDYSKKTSNYSSTTSASGGGALTPGQPTPSRINYSPAPFTTQAAAPAPVRTASPAGGERSSYKCNKESYFKSISSSSNGAPPPSETTAARLSPAAVVPIRSASPTFRNRPRSPAEAYLKKTGGLFGTEPKLFQHPKEEPSFLKSETLKLIQEEQHRLSSPASFSPPSQKLTQPIVAHDSSELPICENCGQKIIGVFCKAGGKCLHPACFQCSTCGTSLKNTGYFLLNDKLYCELHAKQQKSNQFKATDPVDPNIFATYGGPALRSPKSSEPVKASYQPDVLKPGGNIKTFSPSSHFSRQQQHESSYSSKSAFTNGSSKPGSFSPPPPPPASTAAPFTVQSYKANSQQKGNQLTTPAGDGIQLFGPKTPNRGRGVLKQLQECPRIPICQYCNKEIRGPFVLAMSKTWCPDHFVCATPSCHRQLIDVGFIEQNGSNYCEYCYEKLYAPHCSKCQRSITGDCLNALQKQWHTECFTCVHCHKPFGNASFFLENGEPYCEADWNSLFTTKCNSCQFPIEAGDRWVEALGHSYHSDCFCCTVCQKTLEGQNFYAKGGRPYCKAHA